MTFKFKNYYGDPNGKRGVVTIDFPIEIFQIFINGFSRSSGMFRYLAIKLNDGRVLDTTYCAEDAVAYAEFTDGDPSIQKILPCGFQSPYIHNITPVSYGYIFELYCRDQGIDYSKYNNMSVGIAVGMIYDDEAPEILFENFLKNKCLEYYLNQLDLAGKKWGWKYVVSEKLQKEWNDWFGAW